MSASTHFIWPVVVSQRAHSTRTQAGDLHIKHLRRIISKYFAINVSPGTNIDAKYQKKSHNIESMT
jgi:hypothetical protein